jgi:hypothetical protein
MNDQTVTLSSPTISMTNNNMGSPGFQNTPIKFKSEENGFSNVGGLTTSDELTNVIIGKVL